MLPLVTILCLPLSGCESLGGGLDVVNETNQRLHQDQFDAWILPSGGRWRYELNDCSGLDLTVSTGDGKVFAELDEKWCGGDTWTITGKDDSFLTKE
jgi:hypothetical protein